MSISKIKSLNDTFKGCDIICGDIKDYPSCNYDIKSWIFTWVGNNQILCL